MSRRLRDSSRTTVAVRRAIQKSPESIRSLARRYGINPKTVARWKQRGSVDDLKTGPQSRSSVLAIDEEALIVAFRRHLVLPLDDCLGALQSLIPHLTRSSLHRCLQRHGISRQPAPAEDASSQARGESETLGQFRLQVIRVQLRQRQLQIFVAVERSSRVAYVQWYESATAADFLRTLTTSAPCPVRAVLVQDDEPAFRARVFRDACAEHGIELQPGTRLWNDEQLRRIDRTLQQAIDASMRQHRPDLLWWHKLATLVSACNGKCRLHVLGGLTPQEYAGGHGDNLASHGSHRATQSWDAAPQSTRGGTTQAGTARARDRESTREAILEAARSCLAHDGPEGLSLAEVARIAGVNRGTAYQHFKTRENLIAATAEWVSEKLFHAVFGDRQAGARIEQVDVAALTDRLSAFAMDNPELCRAWLLQVLSSPNRTKDRFWREYQESTARFATTTLAQENIDAEVLSVIMLAGAFLWPVWARAHSHADKKEDRRSLAHRFAQECLRISMYGNLRSERYPQIARRLRAYRQPVAGEPSAR